MTPRRDVALLRTGCALVLGGLALYVSGVSRAAGAWLLPFGGAVTAVGWWGTSGRRVSRWAHWSLAVAAVALTALGVWTLVYALAHPPRLV